MQNTTKRRERAIATEKQIDLIKSILAYSKRLKIFQLAPTKDRIIQTINKILTDKGDFNLKLFIINSFLQVNCNTKNNKMQDKKIDFNPFYKRLTLANIYSV